MNDQTVKDAWRQVKLKLALLENRNTKVVSLNRLEGDLLIKTVQRMIDDGEI